MKIERGQKAIALSFTPLIANIDQVYNDKLTPLQSELKFL